MRFLLFLLFGYLAADSSFHPVFSQISFKRTEKEFHPTTIDPDDSYDPFDLDDTSFFSDLSNSTKKLKLHLETEKFIKKYGAQELLNVILKKVQNVVLPPESKYAIDDFLDFVENLIYNNAAERIERKLKLDYSKERKIHAGETNMRNKKTQYEEIKYRRDAPALTQYSSPNSVVIDTDDNYMNQPIEPTKLMYLTRHDPSLIRNEGGEIVKKRRRVIDTTSREIRRSPGARRKRVKTHHISKDMLDRALRTAEDNALQIEKARMVKRLKRKRPHMILRATKKLPISKLEENDMRRSPLKGKISFNEKMFQLLEEYGISSFRVETADYTVRAFADPAKTKFSSMSLLDGPEYSNTVVRRQQQRPAFIYSRTVTMTRKPPVIPAPPPIRNLRKYRKSNGRKMRKYNTSEEKMSLDRLL